MNRKWTEVNYLLSGQNSANKNIKFLCLCGYSKACIIMKEIITVKGTNANNRTDKIINFKSNVSFKSCILKLITHL